MYKATVAHDRMLPPMLIDAARGAHREWRARLEAAIAAGQLDAAVATIAAEDTCRLGRWLLGPGIPPDLKQREGYQAVRSAHARFHRVAGDVARLAAARLVEEARAALAPDGAFQTASSELLDALESWRR